MSQKYMALSAILKRKTMKDCIDNTNPEKIIQESSEEDETSS